MAICKGFEGSRVEGDKSGEHASSGVDGSERGHMGTRGDSSNTCIHDMYTCIHVYSAVCDTSITHRPGGKSGFYPEVSLPMAEMKK
jgi:hypothetical protein